MGCGNTKHKKDAKKILALKESKKAALSNRIITLKFFFVDNSDFEITYADTTQVSTILEQLEKKLNLPKHQKLHFHVDFEKIHLEPEDMKHVLGSLIPLNSNYVAIGIKKCGLSIPNSKADYSKLTHLAKPLFDPFILYILDIQNKKINFDFDIKNQEFDEFAHCSSYCNGNNKLFISGGEIKDSDNNTISSNRFCQIDLITKQTEFFNFEFARKSHSMIYIPNNYVFLVGGTQSNKVEYFDLTTKKLIEHSTQNDYRIEPSLILIDNAFLYAFNGFKQILKFCRTFERINLRCNSRQWERLDVFVTGGLKFEQNLFSVTNYKENEVLFIGGNDYSDNISHNNFIFDYRDNILKASDISSIKEEFYEKSFVYVDDKSTMLLPYFDRNNLKLLVFSDDKINEVQFDSGGSPILI